MGTDGAVEGVELFCRHLRRESGELHPPRDADALGPKVRAFFRRGLPQKSSQMLERAAIGAGDLNGTACFGRAASILPNEAREPEGCFGDFLEMLGSSGVSGQDVHRVPTGRREEAAPFLKDGAEAIFHVFQAGRPARAFWWVGQKGGPEGQLR